MPNLRLTAISPKRDPIELEKQGARITSEMRRFDANFQNAMAKYPPQRSGSSYRRSGDLGKGWVGAPKETLVGGVVVEIERTNRIPYSTFVQGPLKGAKGERQTKAMRARGWQSISSVARVIWNPRRTRIMLALRVGV